MKKYIRVILSVVVTIQLAGCATSKDKLSVYKETPAVDQTSVPSVEKEDKKEQIHMIMVNGTLYCDSGKESEVQGRCGVMDGQVTSSVDPSLEPTQNDQSNFGSGFGYQYGTRDTIEICSNGKWIVFEQRSDKAAN